MIGLMRAAACSSNSSSSCNLPITGLSSVAPPTFCTILRGFKFDFEIGAWLPLCQVATIPCSVVVCCPVAGEIIIKVVLLATEGGINEIQVVMWQLQSLLGSWEPGPLNQIEH